MRLLAFVIVLALSGVCSAQEKWGPLDSCVGVQCKGGYASGTAVPGAPEGMTFIVTANHVLKNRGDDVYWENELYPYKIVTTDAANDLAIIVIKAKLPTIPVAAKMKAGENVSIRGFGWSFFQIRKGTLSNETGSVAKLPVRTGDSGCGYITDDGKLAGVHSGGDKDQGIMNTRAAPAEKVLKLLDTAKVTKFDAPAEPKLSGPAPTPATRYKPSPGVPESAIPSIWGKETTEEITLPDGTRIKVKVIRP